MQQIQKDQVLDSTLAIDFRQVIYSLSDALDFVGIDEVQHGKRVGYMAYEIAAELGWSKEQQIDLFEMGLLHDCGVSSTNVHKHLVEYFDWTSAHIHCEVGHRLLKNFSLLEQMALPIYYHHTHWQELKDLDIDDQVKEYANLIYMVDRIDIFCAAHYGTDILLKRKEIQQAFHEKKGEHFAPHLVEAFIKVSDKQAFWFMIQPSYIERFMVEMGAQSKTVEINLGQLRQIAEIFSQIVDAKSPFTVEHSTGVARLAGKIAELNGVDPVRRQKIEIAGLLHDLGKLRVPDQILEKPGPLTPDERAIIEQHSFETYEILHRITGIEEIARWAAYHHEKVDGKGYPFQVKNGTLEPESRIVAVADVFQALAQNRPYRGSLELPEILNLLNKMVESGSLDGEFVRLVEQNGPECYAAAVGSEG